MLNGERYSVRLRTEDFDDAQAVRSLWLEQALAAEGALPDPEPLPGRTDVCIVGGGFTGLWTALQLKAQEPAISVTLLEADICGSGASGRNGGFVMTAWSKFPSLMKMAGAEEARRYCQASEEAVGEIGAFCDEHGIDAEFARNGWLWVASNQAQTQAWAATVRSIGDRTEAQPFSSLDGDEIRALSGSPTHIGGVLEKGAATVHPAKLARGMARVARERGVVICERSPVREIQREPLELVTDRGTVAADAVVLATNAWTASIPQVRRSLVVIGSDVVATEPVELDEGAPASGVAISDSRRLVNYYHRRPDGTIIFGKGGGELTYDGRVPGWMHRRSSRDSSTLGQLRRMYPGLGDLRGRASWTGPIDYSASGLPFFALLPGPGRVFVGAGFSGNGVGPSHLGGRALASLVRGREPADVPEALCELPKATLPPEPIRYLGGRLVRAAIERKERAEDAGQRGSPVVRAIAGLDPTGGLVDRG